MKRCRDLIQAAVPCAAAVREPFENIPVPTVKLEPIESSPRSTPGTVVLNLLDLRILHFHFHFLFSPWTSVAYTHGQPFKELLQKGGRRPHLLYRARSFHSPAESEYFVGLPHYWKRTQTRW